MFLFRDFSLHIDREIRSSLQQIFGIGWHKAGLILARVGISYPFFIKNINSYYFSIIVYLLKGIVISDVRIKRRIDLNINKLIDIVSYRGVRHKMSLPVHGQRTRTNANTQRSKRVRVRKFGKNLV